MVIWIIGLSGAGKTTLASEIVAQIRRVRQNIVLIDGDVIREVFGNDLGHSLDDRRRNAERICRLCKFLDDQGIHVVCAILSLFKESREWNRLNIGSYYEIFIDAEVSSLIERDPKGIYRKFLSGEIKDVAGMDMEFPRPENADLVIANSRQRDDLLGHAAAIAERILATGQ